MKTAHSAIAVGAIVVTFGAAAAAVSQDKIPYLEREAPKDTTLKGCVTRGAAAGTYILTNVTRDGETTSKETAERMSLVLSDADVEVSKHVGHRVSVTGGYTAELFIPRGAAFTREKPAAAEEVSPGERKTTGTFRVTSLVMVADSCSHAGDEA